jgi:hypothetical protein
MVPVECHGAEIPSMSETEKIIGSIPPTTAVDAGASVLPVVQTSESLLLQMINALKDLVSCIKEAPDADSPLIHSFAFKLAYSVLSSTNRIL